jgi:hypothetical protein
MMVAGMIQCLEFVESLFLLLVPIIPVLTNFFVKEDDTDN